MNFKPLLALAALTVAAPAAANDSDDCLPGLICASAPAGVVKALQAAGYKAKLDKDDGGDPMVSSAAAGYDFDLFFYGCENHAQCDSLQFNITFTHEGNETVALANEWNAAQRFGKAYIDDKGRFRLQYDLATMGGVNPKNFGDTLDWWSATLGAVSKFWDKHPSPNKS